MSTHPGCAAEPPPLPSPLPHLCKERAVLLYVSKVCRMPPLVKQRD